MSTENIVVKKKLDISKFVGTWINTYESSRAIERVIITEEEGIINMQLFGLEGGILAGEWGTVKAIPLSKGPDKTEAVAFQGRIKKEDFEAVLAVNDNKGLLIIAGYFYFSESSEFNDFFAREFYYLA